MKRLHISRPKRQGVVDWLPTDRELRPFHWLAETVVFLKPFGVTQLQAIRAGEVPCRTGHRDTGLPENAPYVATPVGRLEGHETERLVLDYDRVRLVGKVVFLMRGADGERDRAAGEIEHIASQ